MRKLIPALHSFLIVGGLYGSPFVLALLGFLSPTMELAPAAPPREAVFDLASLGLDESATEEEESAGGEQEGEVEAAGPSQPGARPTSGKASGSVMPVPAVIAAVLPVAGRAEKALPMAGREIRKLKKKKRRRKPRKCLEGTDDITEVGPYRYEVDRDLVDHYARDLEALSRLARVQWHENDQGKVDGFQVRRVRCGSILHEAGLRNGDVVHAVNGRRIRSLAKAIPLWWQIRRRPVVHVRISRGDESLRLWYRLS